MQEILELLENNARLSAEELAVLTNKPVEEVEAIMAELKAKGIIVGWRPIINWEKTNREDVSALIELRIRPQKGCGFDALAQRISAFDQVKNLYLMSGGFDLGVFVEGKNIKDIALFVSEHLSQLDGVISTATHFVLKVYKYEGIDFFDPQCDRREVYS